MPTHARLYFAKLALRSAMLVPALALAACGSPTAEPTAAPTTEPTAVIAPTAAPAELTLVLVAKDLVVDAGVCTMLEWESTNARQVYLDGRGVDATGSQEVCPTETTVYVLKAVDSAGTEKSSEVTVEVTAPAATVVPTQAVAATRPPAPTVPVATPLPTAAPTAATVVEFWSDRAQLDEETSCTSVRWRTSGIQEVHLEREGSGRKAVGGEGEEKNICIGRGEKVRYFLIVKHLDGREEKKEILIQREN